MKTAGSGLHKAIRLAKLWRQLQLHCAPGFPEAATSLLLFFACEGKQFRAINISRHRTITESVAICVYSPLISFQAGKNIGDLWKCIGKEKQTAPTVAERYHHRRRMYPTVFIICFESIPPQLLLQPDRIIMIHHHPQRMHRAISGKIPAHPVPDSHQQKHRSCVSRLWLPENEPNGKTPMKLRTPARL